MPRPKTAEKSETGAPVELEAKEEGVLYPFLPNPEGGPDLRKALTGYFPSFSSRRTRGSNRRMGSMIAVDEYGDTRSVRVGLYELRLRCIKDGTIRAFVDDLRSPQESNQAQQQLINNLSKLDDDDLPVFFADAPIRAIDIRTGEPLNDKRGNPAELAYYIGRQRIEIPVATPEIVEAMRAYTKKRAEDAARAEIAIKALAQKAPAAAPVM